MFNVKKKTVREVLASFDKMINELDDIINDSQKDIEERKLIEIVRGTHEEVSVAVEHVDKVELA